MVARALPPELLSVRSTSGELGVEVQRGVQLLDRELAEADMGAYASRGEDDLLLVHVAQRRHVEPPWHGCKALGQTVAPPGSLEDSVRRLSCSLAEEMVLDNLVADLCNAGR